MGYRPQSDDTQPVADRIAVESWARLDGAEKIDRVRVLCRQASRLALAGLRLRHPGENDAELRRRLVEIRLGRELAERVYRHHGG